MSDLSIKAAYASVVEDDEDGYLFVGFAEGEDADEPYVMFRQPLEGGPVWFEVSDEEFGGEGVIESVTVSEKGLTILILPTKAHLMGWLREIKVRIFAHTESADDAVAALQDMLGDKISDLRQA